MFYIFDVILEIFKGTSLIRDLINYRIFRGLQRGANSFTASTAMSLLDLTGKLVNAVRFTAELAFELMSPEKQAITMGRIPHPDFPGRITKIFKGTRS